MSTTTDGFFKTPSEKSKVKTLIVTEFLKSYFPIINRSVGKNQKEIIYIDLFCGPGRYEDGYPSTPLALLNLVNNLKEKRIREKLRIVFNDKDKSFVDQLRELVDDHSVSSKLKYQVEILNEKADDVDVKVYTSKGCPIFSFIDPWGYKGVSVAQTWALVKNIGSDCVLFFNSRRFIMDVGKKTQSRHFIPIFGKQIAEVINTTNNTRLGQKEKAQKVVELFSKNLIDEMSESKRSGYNLYILPFSFEADDKEIISHHIVFITKSHKAIIEMKKVMIKQSNTNQCSLSYANKKQLQISLFHRDNFLTDGIIELLKCGMRKDNIFLSKTWTINLLLKSLDEHNMKTRFQVTPYTESELKGVIEKLDEKGLIDVILPKSNFRKRITYNREFKLKRELLT